MIGGGQLISSFLDEDAIDEFIVTVVPIFIGEGIPLIAPRHLEVPLEHRSVKPFPDGVVQFTTTFEQSADSPQATQDSVDVAAEQQTLPVAEDALRARRFRS
jgi:dihydrofolate reductase